MSLETSRASLPAAQVGPSSSGMQRLGLVLLLALLMAHFAVVQLATAVQAGDAPRNLHWGLLTFENPRFLIGEVDTYERIKGFPPDPAELGPKGLWDNQFASLHRWWGPVVPLLFASVWGLSRSYLMLHLVMPLVGAAAVFLTYRLAQLSLGPGAALLAAAFLSSYPLFREHATMAYTEGFSAAILTAALLSYLRGRTGLTVLLGTLALLSKLDLVLIYTGVMGVALAYAVLQRDTTLTLRHQLLSLVLPLLLAAPWIWMHYLGSGQSSPTAPFSLGLFLIIFPMMIELTFYAPWFISVLTFVVIAVPVVAGLRARALPRLTTVVLGTWLGLGLLVTLVYCATPGAGNSPRIIIPALPALAILFAAGWATLARRWRVYLILYLGIIFWVVNAGVIYYHATSVGQQLRAAQPAFALLHEQERGFVLTPLYWPTILYARQPATWFESDPAFETNIMLNRDHFVRYLDQHPIRYVLLPRHDPPASPEVLDYLATYTQPLQADQFVIYVVPKE